MWKNKILLGKIEKLEEKKNFRTAVNGSAEEEREREIDGSEKQYDSGISLPVASRQTQ